MKVGIYIRVSILRREDGISPETQEARCRRAAEAAGYEVDPRLIWRERCTATDLERPKLNEALHAARAGLISALFVYTPDRLSREPAHLLMLLDELQGCGVKLRFAGGISDCTPAGQLLMYVQRNAGRHERALTAERSMRAREVIAKSGRLPHGSNAGPFGYDYDSIRKERTINEAEAAVVRLMFQWASQGVRTFRIARKLNAMDVRTRKGRSWRPTAVRRVLNNSAYAGVDFYGKSRSQKEGHHKRSVASRAADEVIRIEGFSPPIITAQLFEEVQQRLKPCQGRAS